MRTLFLSVLGFAATVGLPACGAAPPRGALVETARDMFRAIADAEIESAEKDLTLESALEQDDRARVRALVRERLLARRDVLRRLLAENRRGEFEAQLTRDQRPKIESQIRALEAALVRMPGQ